MELLRSNELVFVSESHEISASQLGKAVVWSGLSPNEGQSVLRELERARSNLNLENELHMLYLVTPHYLVDIVAELDWYHYMRLWGRLPVEWKKIGNLVGVDDAGLVTAVRGRLENASKTACMRRFYWYVMIKTSC